MPGRIRSITGHRREYLNSGWALASSPPSQSGDLKTAEALSWTSIQTPTTAAAALRALNRWSVDEPARRFDAEEWWYRLRFKAPPAGGDRTLLGFDGLAGIAEAWLNGHSILRSDNMFVAHELTVDALLKDDNELLLRFQSLDTLLAARRPRPRWRTPMIEHQQLRWFRTTLLGRTPGWSPPAAPVGIWRPVWLEQRPAFSVDDLDIHTGAQGSTGFMTVRGRLRGELGTNVAFVDVALTRNGKTHSASVKAERDGSFAGRLEIADADLWWPHTHGEPALYEANLSVRHAKQNLNIDLGRVGFRSVAVDTNNGGFAVSINGVPLFCRGACWTPLDCAALSADRAAYDNAIEQVRAAGMNMLRVSGTMVYESDDFLDACDEHGILLWQDFMFANMDYPSGDAAFDAGVGLECVQQMKRLAGRPCLAVLCGNSEGEQQAAMWGAPRELWTHPLFHRVLPELTSAHAPGVPYWPSSTHGGAFAHQSNRGTSSYYGVGAYLRPLTDARRAEVSFASECLAFANVPEEETLARVPGGPALKVHQPQWKARVPRDLGAGWDFDDVRDHYLAELFGVDPMRLRYAEHERYLDLSRAVSGEVMAAAFREWRRGRSTCTGALIWFLRDLWPGAGWGIVASDGVAKAPYFYLRRALQPRSIHLSDEGGNGLYIHVSNERAETLRGSIELNLYRDGEVHVARGAQAVEIAARGALELPAAGLLEGFMDLTYAYRFGPAPCDLIVATLLDGSGAEVAQDFYFPKGHQSLPAGEPGLTARVLTAGGEQAQVLIETRRFAYGVTVRAEGFAAPDQYFHLAPGTQRTLALRRLTPEVGLRGVIHALNAPAPVRIQPASSH